MFYERSMKKKMNKTIKTLLELNGIRIFTKELIIKEFGEEEYNKL